MSGGRRSGASPAPPVGRPAEVPVVDGDGLFRGRGGGDRWCARRSGRRFPSCERAKPSTSPAGRTGPGGTTSMCGPTSCGAARPRRPGSPGTRRRPASASPPRPPAAAPDRSRIRPGEDVPARPNHQEPSARADDRRRRRRRRRRHGAGRQCEPAPPGARAVGAVPAQGLRVRARHPGGHRGPMAAGGLLVLNAGPGPGRGPCQPDRGAGRGRAVRRAAHPGLPAGRARRPARLGRPRARRLPRRRVGLRRRRRPRWRRSRCSGTWPVSAGPAPPRVWRRRSSSSATSGIMGGFAGLILAQPDGIGLLLGLVLCCVAYDIGGYLAGPASGAATSLPPSRPTRRPRVSWPAWPPRC